MLKQITIKKVNDLEYIVNTRKVLAAFYPKSKMVQVEHWKVNNMTGRGMKKHLTNVLNTCVIRVIYPNLKTERE